MGGMFYGCSSLQSLNVSGFNTENVTSMSGMFNYSSLSSLRVGQFTNASKCIPDFGVARNGVLYYPSGTNYDSWLAKLNDFGWTGQTY